MVTSSGLFEEFLNDIGIPNNHSIFAAAYGNSVWGESGFRLMPLNEAAECAYEGKNVLWFYRELKRRYENIHYFFKQP